MPSEYTALKGRPVPGAPLDCRHCGIPIEDPSELFMRGQVQSWWRRKLRQPYCALICRYCRAITGWERP